MGKAHFNPGKSRNRRGFLRKTAALTGGALATGARAASLPIPRSAQEAGRPIEASAYGMLDHHAERPRLRAPPRGHARHRPEDASAGDPRHAEAAAAVHDGRHALPVGVALPPMACSPASSGPACPPTARPYTRSIPMEKLLDDTLIAYAMNGEALRPENGYPVRAVVPGWEGNISVKWLRRIKVGDQSWHFRSETARYTDPMPDGLWRRFSRRPGPAGGARFGGRGQAHLRRQVRLLPRRRGEGRAGLRPHGGRHRLLQDQRTGAHPGQHVSVRADPVRCGSRPWQGFPVA